MSKLNAGISEAMYAIKQWRGVNENPDGDTNLKNGEGAVMRNFRITDGGALRKRPGSAIVAGLVNSYAVAVGAEKKVLTEKNRSTFAADMYSSLTVDEQGKIILTGTMAGSMSYANNADFANYYYAASDPTKAWQHTRVVYTKASGDFYGDGGAVNFGTEKDYLFCTGAYFVNQPDDCPKLDKVTVYDSIKVTNGNHPLSQRGIGQGDFLFLTH